MGNRNALLGAVAAAGAVTLAAWAPLVARPLGPVLQACPPCLRVTNAFVRADIGPSGVWALGTTGGDPGTLLDDDKELLYGFRPGGNSQLGSSFTTIRVVSPAGVFDTVPVVAADQVDQGDRVATVWLTQAQHRVRVTQTLRIVPNAYSGYPDAVAFRYDLANLDSVTVALGVRTLLDVQIGATDGAPYIVPGVGSVTQEREFVGEFVPPFWLAFESQVFDPNQLRGLGLLRGPDLTPPDRMVIARWRHIQDTQWDYAIEPTEAVTVDSAVALYWQPQEVAPGAVRTIQSLYGVAGSRGGSAFLTAPLSASCGTSFVAALFVSNFDPAPLSGGLATVVLPPGLRLVAGESATKPMPEIAPGGTGSVAWQLVLGAAEQGPRRIQANAVFDGGRQFAAQADLDAICLTPTPSPTHPATPSPTPTLAPTATPTRRPTATPTPFGTPPSYANACPFIRGRVPEVAINWALANPDRVRGWLELLNPGLPISPSNPRKTWLSLQNIAAPYHPLFNALVFKVGCP